MNAPQPPDLTTWTIETDTSDGEKTTTLRWPALAALYDETPLEDLDGLTAEDYAGALARARAITATTLYVLTGLGSDERPTSRYVDLGEDDFTSAPVIIVTGMPPKALRECVETAEALIDVPSNLDADYPYADIVSGYREERDRDKAVRDRVKCLVGDNAHLRHWVWNQLRAIHTSAGDEDSHERQVAWLDQFGLDMTQHHAALAAGAQPPKTGHMAEYHAWWFEDREAISKLREEAERDRLRTDLERARIRDEQERLTSLSQALRERDRQITARERALEKAAADA